ncbi:MAG: hypothetical protein DI556_15705 [Rhodovulum sulfidophilum]|uniref:2-keto-4-pentenoate hydratase n=1 Tax=Rhodovulum sulfidophilum TaxID=35806 RepID=A0A2W5N355_RHOSU|nr:MAG: hypothetical protein DI556_15705 [Rhodovulum sulfidophilum]
MTTTDTRLEAAAAILRDARTGPRPADFPAELIPTSEAEAYRVQDLVLDGGAVAGWKILATATPETFTCAPLPAADELANGGVLVLGDRAPEIEVEIAIRLVADLPARAGGYDAASVLPALGTAHVAFEIVESRFLDRKRVGPLSGLADSQSSRGVAIGAKGVEGWRDLPLAELPIRLIGDGAETARARGGATAEQVVAALVWLANHAPTRGPGLRAGQVVITGARIGPIPILATKRLVAEIDGIGSVALDLA